jgi:NADH-quinone oxidoreductase subunit L
MFATWINVFVMANNLILVFFGWEVVGLSSYLLISFWKERQQSVKSSFKALVYNKVGDIILLLAVSTAFELSKTIDLLLSITLFP